jgi:APA family basic amino acid/polyamine antiporter
MLPKAGGSFNYIKRAFGNYAGFIAGWFDYIINAIAPAYFSIAITEYLSLIVPALNDYGTIIAVILLVLFTVLHLAGLKSGSLVQQVTSFIKIAAFAILITCCFLFGGNNDTPVDINDSVSQNFALTGLFILFIRSLQLIMGTYDGWASPVFFAEENTNPGKSIPRSLFGGALIVMGIYILINLALLYVIPMSVIAGSKLAVADAAEIIFGKVGYTILILIAIFSLLSILNAIVMICPRILFGLSREGFFIEKGTLINKGGTPYVALIITFLIQIFLVILSSFEQLFALGAFMTMMVSTLMFSSVIKLRKTEPLLPRPYRVRGYPFTAWLMVLISIALFVSYTFADPTNFVVIIALIALSWPAFYLIKKKNT